MAAPEADRNLSNWTERNAEVPAFFVYFLIILGFGIICSNTLTLIVLFCSSLRGITYYFLVNLSLADLLVGVAASLQGVIYSKELQNNEKWCMASAILAILACGTSITGFFFITIERYVTVMFPLRRVNIVTPRKIWTAIACSWGSSTVSAIVPYVFFFDSEPRRHCLTMAGSLGTYWFVLVLLTLFTILVIVFMYGKIAREAARHMQVIGVQEVCASRTRATSQSSTGELTDRKKFNIRKTMKLAKTLSMVIGLFCVCWLPFNTTVIVSYLCPVNICPRLDPDNMIILYTASVAYINSFLNIFVYAFRFQEFQEGLRKVLRFVCLSVWTEPSVQYGRGIEVQVLPFHI